MGNKVDTDKIKDSKKPASSSDAASMCGLLLIILIIGGILWLTPTERESAFNEACESPSLPQELIACAESSLEYYDELRNDFLSFGNKGGGDSEKALSAYWDSIDALLAAGNYETFQIIESYYGLGDIKDNFYAKYAPQVRASDQTTLKVVEYKARFMLAGVGGSLDPYGAATLLAEYAPKSKTIGYLAAKTFKHYGCSYDQAVFEDFADNHDYWNTPYLPTFVGKALPGYELSAVDVASVAKDRARMRMDPNASYAISEECAIHHYADAEK